MSDNVFSAAPRRTPWNKGKLIGARPPLRPKHVWSIRTRLLVEGRTRDLAMFNLAIDSKLRGCDVTALRVEDIAPNGYAIDRATVRQKKTGRPVKFELTDQNSSGCRRLSESHRQEAWRISIHGPTRHRPMHDDAPICTARLRLAHQHRARPAPVRHPLASEDQGNSDLPTHRQPARRPALAWPH